MIIACKEIEREALAALKAANALKGTPRYVPKVGCEIEAPCHMHREQVGDTCFYPGTAAIPFLKKGPDGVLRLSSAKELTAAHLAEEGKKH